jgi:DNA-binding transcriptional LysR family regulator
LGAEVLAGPLRISAPIILGRERIAPLLDAFLLAHPGVTAELLLIEDNGIEDNGADQRRADPAVDGLWASVDVAVRLSTSGDSALRVQWVGRNRRLVIASPDYLEAHGVPKSPTDLAHHNCLCAHFDSHWAFQESGRAFVVAVSGDRVATDPALVRRWCLQGRGLALESEWHVADDLARGRLVQVLSDYAPAPGALQVVLPPGRSPSRQVEVFADVLTSALQG